MPTPSVRASTYGTYFSSGTITMPTHQSGDLLLIFIVSSQVVTSISGTGWSFFCPAEVTSGDTSGRHTVIYKTAAGSSETAPTITYGGTPSTDWYAFALQDVDVATRAWGLFDVNHELFAGSVTTVQQGNAASRYQNALLLHLFVDLEGKAGAQTANSWTHIGTNDGASRDTAMYVRSVSAAGSVTAPSFARSSGSNQAETFTFTVLGSNAGLPQSIAFSKPNYACHDTSGNGLTLRQFDLFCSHPSYDYHLHFALGPTNLAQSSTTPFTTPSGLTGWEQIGNLTDNLGYLCVWIKPATVVTTSTGLSWTMVSAVDGQIMVTVKGLHPTRPIATQGWTGGSITSSTSRPVTELLTTHPNQTHLLMFSDIGYGVDLTWPSGYTQIAQAKETSAGATIGMAYKTFADSNSNTGPYNVTTSASSLGRTFGILFLGAADDPAQTSPFILSRGDFAEQTSATTTSLYRVDLQDGDFIVLFGYCADTAAEVTQTITTPAETNVLKLVEYDAANAWNNHTRLIEVTSDFSGTLVYTITNDPGADINAGMVVVRGVASSDLFEFFEVVDNAASSNGTLTPTLVKDFPEGSVGAINVVFQKASTATPAMAAGNWSEPDRPGSATGFDSTSPTSSWWKPFINFNAQPETDWLDVDIVAAPDKAMLHGFLVQGAKAPVGMFMGQDF